MSEATMTIGTTAGTSRGLKDTDFNPCIFWTESVTPLGSGAAMTQASRNAGVGAAVNGVYGAFNAFFYADQTGTAQIECSQDNTTWFPATAAAALTAGTPLVLSIPVVMRYNRAKFVNGGTAQGVFACATSYSATKAN